MIRRPAGRTAPAEGDTWTHIGVLLSLPWVLFLINSNWLFQGLGHMDPWYYFGHFIHFPHYQALRPSYAGERLPWVLPGFILTRVFTAPYGAMMLNVASYSVALLCLYSIVKRATDARTALSTACLMGCHAGFIGANGWSYPDGGAIAYLSVSYACLARSARSAHPRRDLVGAGASWAALVSTYVAWVTLTPVCLLLYLAGEDERGGAQRLRDRLCSLMPAAGWFALGLALMTLGLTAVDYGLFGSRRFFLAHNVSAAAAFVAGESDSHSYAWVLSAARIVLPGLATILASGVLVFRLTRRAPIGRPVLLLSLACLYSVLVMVAVTIRGTPSMLKLDYHVSILFPAVFGVFGATCWRVPTAVTSSGWTVILLAACLISTAGLWSPGLPMRLLGGAVLWPWLVGALGVLAWLAMPGRLSTWVVSVLCLGAASFGLIPTYTGRAWTSVYDGRAASLRVARAVQIVAKHFPGQAYPVFWIDNSTDPFSAEYRAIMCAFVAHGISMWEYPRVDPRRTYPPGTLIVLATRRRDVFEEANATMTAAGMPLGLAGQEAVDGPGSAYWLTFVRVLEARRTTEPPPAAIIGRLQGPQTRREQ